MWSSTGECESIRGESEREERAEQSRACRQHRQHRTGAHKGRDQREEDKGCYEERANRQAGRNRGVGMVIDPKVTHESCRGREEMGWASGADRGPSSEH